MTSDYGQIRQWLESTLYTHELQPEQRRGLLAAIDIIEKLESLDLSVEVHVKDYYAPKEAGV